MAWTDNSYKFPFLEEQEKRNNPKYKDVPLIVAPGKEDAYLKDKAKNEAAKVAEAERIIKEKNETEALQEDAEQQLQITDLKRLSQIFKTKYQKQLKSKMKI